MHQHRFQSLCTLVLAVTVAALALRPPPALAQLPGLDLFASDEGVPEFTVRIGWPGRTPGIAHAPAERPVPIRVTLQGGDAAVEGAVVLTYLQDNSQNTRLVAPFATTPGATSHVDLIATFPANLDTATLTVATDEGAAETDIEFGHNTPNVTAPAGINLASVVVGAVAARAPDPAIAPQGHRHDRQPNETFGQPWRSTDAPLQNNMNLWSEAAVSALEPDELPTHWSAYTSLAVLVVDERLARQIPPRALRAIHTWVESGGRLVILTGAAGDNWTALLPPALAAPGQQPVSAFAGQRVPIAPEIRRLAAEAAGDTTPNHSNPDPSDPDPSDPGHSNPDPASDPALDAPVSQRLFAITQQGHAHGWRLRWTRQDQPDPANPRAPVAHGPAGFGWITLVGVAPERVPARLDAAASAAVWRDLLAHAATLRLAERPGQQFYGFYTPASGANASEQTAIERAITAASGQGANVGPLFAGLIAALVLLTMLLGPVDFLVLKRLRVRHLSWLTASVYIFLFTAAAAVIPQLVRTGDTEANSAETLDILRFNTPDTLAQDAPVLAWRTGVIGLNSQSSAPFQLDPDPFGRDIAWRGVSSLPGYSANPAAALAPVTYSAIPAPRPAAPIPAPLWTYRALAHHGPAQPTPDHPLPDAQLFILTPGRFPAYTAELRRLPPAGVITDARLLTRAGDLGPDQPLPITITPEGAATLSFSSRHPTPFDRRRALLTDPPDTTNAIADPGNLPGALDRNRALAARLAAGTWGLLDLTIEHADPRLPITERTREGDRPPNQRAARRLRILVPLPETTDNAPAQP